MGAPAEPPPYCVSYGTYSVSSSSYANIILPCKMETSFSLPPSPSSSHSSLSLEPLPSSPSHSSSCLAEPFSYNHLLSTDIRTLLDTPCSSHSFHLSKAPPSLKKRPASPSCELEASTQLGGVPTGPKRICESAGSDGSIAYRSRETISSCVDNALLSNHGHSNELLDSEIWRNGCGAENVTSGDLDDVLDLLLQEAEVAPSLTAQSSLGCHESSLLAYKLDHCKEEHEELYSCKPSNSHENDHLASSARSTRTWSNTLQGLLRGQSSTGGSAVSDTLQDLLRGQRLMGVSAVSDSAGTIAGAAMQGSQTEAEANAMSFCEELMKQIAPKCASAKQEQNDERQEEERLQEGQANSKTKQHRVSPLGACSKWAGPTLLDIESALAMTSPPSTMYPSRCLSSPLDKHPPTASSFLCSIRDILNQDPPSHFLSSFSCKEEPNQEEDDKLSTWRRLQKRNQMEPRYTVKIRCEEDAVNDGYRWRKYGQKSIKNSPYPRSYYRCSSGKCSVKKQVERSGEDAGLLLVSYEGIHLHHRPTSLSPTPLTCAAPPPTCEPSFANPHPQSR